MGPIDFSSDTEDDQPHYPTYNDKYLSADCHEGFLLPDNVHFFMSDPNQRRQLPTSIRVWRGYCPANPAMPSSSTHLSLPPSISSVPPLQCFTPFSELPGSLEPPTTDPPPLHSIPLRLSSAGPSLIPPPSPTPKPPPALWTTPPSCMSPDPLVTTHTILTPLFSTVSDTSHIPLPEVLEEPPPVMDIFKKPPPATEVFKEPSPAMEVFEEPPPSSKKAKGKQRTDVQDNKPLAIDSTLANPVCSPLLQPPSLPPSQDTADLARFSQAASLTTSRFSGMISIVKRLKRAFCIYPCEVEPSAFPITPPRPHGQEFGIKELSPGISPTIDIVAIHGLDGHREVSWTAHNGKLWIRDFLPQDVPSARILTYGYDAYTQSTAKSSVQTLDSHAENFLVRLAAFRGTSDTTKRPIIFIAHSIGGIILKHALIQANQAHRGHLVEHKWIALSTYGILFLGTPHQGTTAMTNPANQLLKLASPSSKNNNILLKHLTSNSEWLQQQLSFYNPISANFRTTFFYETLPTILPDKSFQIIVPKFSAVIPGAVDMEVVGMSKDHNGMTKLPSQRDDDFIVILSTIQNMIKNALLMVQRQWFKFDHIEVECTGVTYNAELRPSPRFIGQEKYLTTLKNFFAPGNSQSWRHFLLYGMAGVGKTQICLKFIEEILDNDHDYFRIIWIDATDIVSLENSFSKIADEPEAKAIDLKRSSDTILTWLAHNRKKWLLVFDNADGMDGEILKYLDKIRSIHTLITSRSPVLSTHVTSYLEILPMDQDNAVSLFQTAARLSKDSNTTMITLSKHIVEALGSLPLAVDIAGATISAGLCTLQDYLKMYQIQAANLLDVNHPSLKGASQYNHTMYSALNVSYNLIETSATFHKTAQNALFILKVLGFFHHQNVMETIFKQAAEAVPPIIYDEQLQTTTSDLPTHLLKCNEDGEWSNIEFRQAMQVLCDCSLLSKGGVTWGSLHWTMHPVTHVWSRDKAFQREDLLYIHTARAILIASIPFGTDVEDIIQRRKLLLHIEVFRSKSCGRVNTDVYYDDMYNRFSSVLGELGHWKTAENMQEVLMMKRETILGAEHSQTLAAKNTLAITYCDLGRYKQAEMLQLQVLKIQQQILGPEHLNTVKTKASLAVTYCHLGRYKEAEVLEVQVLEAKQHILGLEHPSTVEAKANLASTYRDLGRHKEAEVLKLQVLETLQKTLGPDHLSTVQAKANLASTYCDLGRPKEAEVLECQVLEAKQNMLGPEHPSTVGAKANLASTYQDLGRHKEAEVLQLQVLEAYQQTLGPDHLSTVQAKANLASTYCDLGRPKEAEVLECQVLEAKQHILGLEHPSTVEAKANLASTYQDLGRHKEAEVLKLQVFETLQKTLGPDHLSTVQTKANLASTYCDLGRPKEAEVLHLQVLEAKQNILGPEHPSTVEAKANLARTYRDLGRHKEAEVLKLQVLETLQKTLGPDHLSTVQAKANLASTYCDLGRPKEAEVLECQVLEAKQNMLGPEHPSTVEAKANLASTYQDLRRHKEAEVLKLQVLEAYQQTLGPDHLSTVQAKANLASTYCDLGRPKEAEVLECQVLEAKQHILGLEHPSTVEAKANLASTYQDLGRHKEAEVLQLQVLEVYQQKLGPDHLSTVQAKANLASTYCDLGRPKEAEVLDLQVLEAKQNILGLEHPSTVEATANLASSYQDLGRHKEAEVLKLQVLETLQKMLGPDHLSTVQTKANLASTYCDLGRPKEAEVLHLQVLEAKQNMLGPEHPSTVGAKANLQ
ncbi:hypothetical protein BU17DRAFT_98072 [Hysterangium stoloniferum]|nr:hypothetical protein BU17DRAFT_98072 [Hysterangium stoloniferum]